MTFDDMKAPLIGTLLLGGSLLTPRYFDSRRRSSIVSSNVRYKDEFERMYPSVTDSSWSKMSQKKKDRLRARTIRSLQKKGVY